MSSALEFNKKISQNGSTVYAASSAGTDTYAISLVPAISSYTTGLVVNFEADVANTGAATLNCNSVGAITIKKNHDQDLANNDIEAGQIVTVVYDGTNFQMQSQIANTSSGSGGKILTIDSVTKTDTFTSTSTSFTAVTGLATAGITPASSSNKILVQANIFYGGVNSNFAALYRQINSGGWSAIAIGDTAGNRIRASMASGSLGNAGHHAGAGINYLDSPATTNLVEYAIYVIAQSTFTLYINRSTTDSDSAAYARGISSITAMEVDGT